MFATSLPPAAVLPSFEYRLRSSLRGLSDPFLAALVSGLERHGDELAPNRLYTSREGGGCAVGAMMRELNPDAFQVGRMRFWWRHGRKKSATKYGGVFECPRVWDLERIFDQAVNVMHGAEREIPDPDIPRVVGRWILERARAELGRRHDRVIGSPPKRPATRAVTPALATA